MTRNEKNPIVIGLTAAELTQFLGAALSQVQPPMEKKGAILQAAVTVNLLPKADQLLALLVKRSPDLDRHPGEISFPGGTQEKVDHSFLQTALRETREEVGLDPQQKGKFCGYLQPVNTSTGFNVLPCVFVLSEMPELTLDAREVQRSLWFELVSSSASEKMVQLGPYSWPEYWDAKDRVWGASGRILHQLLRVLKLK